MAANHGSEGFRLVNASAVWSTRSNVLQQLDACLVCRLSAPPASAARSATSGRPFDCSLPPITPVVIPCPQSALRPLDEFCPLHPPTVTPPRDALAQARRRTHLFFVRSEFQPALLIRTLPRFCSVDHRFALQGLTHLLSTHGPIASEF
jgi:hypothetical protein